jgi:hypothetical protein
VGNSLACAEFDRRAGLAAVHSRGVELGDDGVVAAVLRSKQCSLRRTGMAPRATAAIDTHALSVVDDVYALADALRPQG